MILNRAAPTTGLAAARLDELLETFEVAIDPPIHEAQRVTQTLEEPLRIVVDGQRDACHVIADAMEIDGASVHIPRCAGPGDALVRDLLGDARIPLLLSAANHGAPVEALIVELVDFLTPSMNCGKVSNWVHWL